MLLVLVPSVNNQSQSGNGFSFGVTTAGGNSFGISTGGGSGNNSFGISTAGGNGFGIRHHKPLTLLLEKDLYYGI
jgi:hypothetical protein